MKRQLTITGDGHQTMMLVSRERKEKIVVRKANYCYFLSYDSDLLSRLRTLRAVWRFTKR